MSGLSIPQMTMQLRNIAGQNNVILPDIDSVDYIGALTYINTAFWEVLNKFNFRQAEVVANTVTMAGQSIYACPVLLDAVTSISVLDLPNNGTKYNKLDQMDLNIYRGLQDTNTDAQGLPCNYIRNGSDYILYPTPNDIYPVQIDYLETITDVLSSGQPPIPREWHEIIKYGAAWRILSDLNGDIIRSQHYINLQTRLMNSTVPVQEKEEADYSNAGVNVKGREYD